MNTPSPSDIESLLQSLAPEPLATNRDELFFRAGYAAGVKSRSAHRFWPSAVAALLIVCVGLGLALQRQTLALNTARAANAVSPGNDSRGESQVIAINQHTRDTEEVRPENSESIAKEIHSSSPPQRNELLSDSRLQVWQQLANANFRIRGHLTARGWVESPDADREPPPPSDEEPAPRRRPSTYLELRQLHLEG